MDLALQVLHQATRNDNLLESRNGSGMTFWRVGGQIASSGGSFRAAGWNHYDGNIYFANGTFTSNVFAREVLLHEIGHNWERYDAERWEALSGWATTNQSNNAAFILAGSDERGQWYYLTTAQFVSDYAKTIPGEDFAESFAAYFMQRVGWRFPRVGTPISEIAGKMRFLNTMLSNLS